MGLLRSGAAPQARHGSARRGAEGYTALVLGERSACVHGLWQRARCCAGLARSWAGGAGWERLARRLMAPLEVFVGRCGVKYGSYPGGWEKRTRLDYTVQATTPAKGRGGGPGTMSPRGPSATLMSGAGAGVGKPLGPQDHGGKKASRNPGRASFNEIDKSGMTCWVWQGGLK